MSDFKNFFLSPQPTLSLFLGAHTPPYNLKLPVVLEEPFLQQTLEYGSGWQKMHSSQSVELVYLCNDNMYLRNEVVITSFLKNKTGNNIYNFSSYNFNNSSHTTA